MKKKVFSGIILFSFVICNMALADENPGFVKNLWRKFLNRGRTAEEKAAPVAAKPAPAIRDQKPLEDLSEEELKERITMMIESTPEAADFVQEADLTIGENGEIAGIQGLDKETLMRLYSRVARERTRIQTERIQAQLQAIQAAQRAAQAAAQQPPRIPQPPPQPPSIPKPPPVPPKPPDIPRR